MLLEEWSVCVVEKYEIVNCGRVDQEKSVGKSMFSIFRSKARE